MNKPSSYQRFSWKKEKYEKPALTMHVKVGSALLRFFLSLVDIVS